MDFSYFKKCPECHAVFGFSVYGADPLFVLRISRRYAQRILQHMNRHEEKKRMVLAAKLVFGLQEGNAHG